MTLTIGTFTNASVSTLALRDHSALPESHANRSAKAGFTTAGQCDREVMRKCHQHIKNENLVTVSKVLQMPESDEGDTCGLRCVNPKTVFCEVIRSAVVHASSNMWKKIRGFEDD